MGRAKKCRDNSCRCRNCPGDYDQYQSDSSVVLEPSNWLSKQKIIVIYICSSWPSQTETATYYGYFSLNGLAMLASTSDNGHIGRIYKSDENTTISDSEWNESASSPATGGLLLPTTINCGGEAEQESFDPDILLPNPPPLPWPDPHKKTKNVISFGFSGGGTPGDGVNCEVIVASYPYPYRPRYEQGGSFTFSWPVSGATITSEVSIDNAAYVATVGVVTFLRTVGSLHYYTLPYNTWGRPGRLGETYKFTDGTFTQYYNTECTYLDRRWWRRGGNWDYAGYGTYECRIARYQGFVPFYSTQYLEFELCQPDSYYSS